MKGEDFEAGFCELLKSVGYWALNIPKNKSGAQPFDVIALKGSSVLAVDCKVCTADRFPLSRIEDNQWLAFETVDKKSIAWVGIAVLYKGDIYFFNYRDLVKCRDCDIKSVQLKGNSSKIWFSKDEIKNITGKVLR